MRVVSRFLRGLPIDVVDRGTSKQMWYIGTHFPPLGGGSYPVLECSTLREVSNRLIALVTYIHCVSRVSITPRPSESVAYQNRTVTSMLLFVTPPLPNKYFVAHHLFSNTYITCHVRDGQLNVTVWMVFRSLLFVVSFGTVGTKTSSTLDL